MLQSLLFLNALCFGVGMPLVCQENTQQIQEKVEFKQDNRKFVSYDDTHLDITLSADELNNYTWFNLDDMNENGDNFSFEGLGCNYNDLYYAYNDYSEGAFWYANTDGTYILFINDYESWFANNELEAINYHFYFKDSNADVPSLDSFTSSVQFVIDSESTGEYLEFKEAIELDIQANTQPHLQPVLTELVSLLTAGITSLASGIGQGVSTLVSDIFINNGALSTFGAVICIFGGIALAIGLSRWVMNFLTSLGAKK